MDNSVDKLVGRACKLWLFHRVSLDNTSLGKHCHQTVPFGTMLRGHTHESIGLVTSRNPPVRTTPATKTLSQMPLVTQASRERVRTSGRANSRTRVRMTMKEMNNPEKNVRVPYMHVDPLAAVSKYLNDERIQKLPSYGDLGIEAAQVWTQPSQHDVRVYVLSDLHIDDETNLVWVTAHCLKRPEDRNVYSVLIIPGDIGSESDRIESVLRVLANSHDAVVYVVGNHEAWSRGKNRNHTNSFVKIAEVCRRARNVGVHIGPLRVRVYGNPDKAVSIFPLYSWYHASWDTEPDITNVVHEAAEKRVPFVRKWRDFNKCTWPEEFCSHDAFATTSRESFANNTRLAEVFSSANEPCLLLPSVIASNTTEGRVFGSPLVGAQDGVISFSHFVPRQELCPEKRFLIEPLLSRVVGSDPLEAQVRRLNPHLHLYGHTHIPMDMELDGIRYIQWPLGYSKEAHLQCAPIRQVGPMLVYDTGLGGGSEGIPKLLPSLKTAWTEYYQNYDRDPSVIEPLAPWVLRRWAKKRR